VRPVPALVPALVALACATACGAPAPASPPVAPAVPAPVTAAPVTPAPAPDPAAGAVPAGGGSWTMPDLVGVGLQDAQDAIQGLTDFAIPITTSSDATGRDRMQVDDRNWRVCAQSVPAGAEITPSSAIDFAVVQLDEDC
jgi:hypothetical protein